jgi:hypothetical protein
VSAVLFALWIASLPPPDGEDADVPLSDAELRLLERLLEPLPWEPPGPDGRPVPPVRLQEPVAPTAAAALDELPVPSLVPAFDPRRRTLFLGPVPIDPAIGGWLALHPDLLDGLHLRRDSAFASATDREGLRLNLGAPPASGARTRWATTARTADRSAGLLGRGAGAAGPWFGHVGALGEAAEAVRGPRGDRPDHRGHRVQAVATTGLGSRTGPRVEGVGAYARNWDGDQPTERFLVGVRTRLPAGAWTLDAAGSVQGDRGSGPDRTAGIGFGRLSCRLFPAGQAFAEGLAGVGRIEAGAGLRLRSGAWRLSGAAHYLRHGDGPDAVEADPRVREELGLTLKAQAPLAERWRWTMFARRGLEGLEDGVDRPGPPPRPDRRVHRVGTGPQVSAVWGHASTELGFAWIDPFDGPAAAAGWLRASLVVRPAGPFTVAASGAGFELPGVAGRSEGAPLRYRGRERGGVGHLSLRLDLEGVGLEGHVRAGYRSMSAPDGFVSVGTLTTVPLGAGFRLALALSNGLDQALVDPITRTQQPGIDLRLRLDFTAGPRKSSARDSVSAPP